MNVISQTVRDEELKSQSGLVPCPGLQLLNIRTRILALFPLGYIVHINFFTLFILIKLIFRTIVINELVITSFREASSFLLLGLHTLIKQTSQNDLSPNTLYTILDYFYYLFFTRNNLF